jgi:hypothetical protein
MNYLQKKIKKIGKGQKAKGILSYLNDLDKLCSLKSTADSVESFLDLAHLDNALAVRAAFKVQDVIKKIESSKEKKVITLNELYAQEIVLMIKSHMLYLSFVTFMNLIETQKWQDQNIRPILRILAKVFALK